MSGLLISAWVSAFFSGLSIGVLIGKHLASAIETEGQDREDGLRAEHESATRRGDAQ